MCKLNADWILLAESNATGLVPYASGPDCAVQGPIRLIGDRPASSNAGHYLSDHFGLRFELVLMGGEQP